MSYQVIPILNPKYNMVRGARKRINSLPAEARPACISHYNILHPFPSQFTPLSLLLAAAAEESCVQQQQKNTWCFAQGKKAMHQPGMEKEGAL